MHGSPTTTLPVNDTAVSVERITCIHLGELGRCRRSPIRIATFPQITLHFEAA